MFSKTCEYAIRAVIFIAQKSQDGERVSIKTIASGIDSPEHFIAKILQDLSRRGLVQSMKGPNGGFFLNEASRKLTLSDIVKAVDGNQIFVGCALGLKNCSEKEPCPLHHQFKAIRNQIQMMLQSTRVGELSEDLDLGLSYLKER